MKVVLTVIIMLMGQQPEAIQMPAENVDQCYAMAADFVRTQQDILKGAGDQIAAGCTVVKTEEDRGA